MISPVITTVEGMKKKNQNKIKFGEGFVVKEKVGEIEENTMEIRSSRIRK